MQGTHAEVLGYAVLSLVVVVVFEDVQVAEKISCDCCVVHTADSLAVVAVAVAVVHGKKTAVAAVVAVTGVPEMPVDFPTKEQIKKLAHAGSFDKVPVQSEIVIG